MIIFIKLLQAIVLGLLMVLSLLLLMVAGLFFIGYISELLGFKNLAAVMYSIQENMWYRTKRWFFRYNKNNKKD